MAVKKILFTIVIFCLSITCLVAQNNSELMLARQYYFNGDYQKAASIYQKLYQDNTFKEIVFDDYFNSLLKVNAYDEAEKIIRKKIKSDPKNASLLMNLGLVYHYKGDAAEAEKTFTEVLKNLKPDAFSINQIASNFYSIANYNMAAKTFLAGRKVLANENEFVLELVRIYRFLRNKDGLATEIIKLAETNPEFVGVAKSELSRTFETTEDYQSFKSLLLKRIQKDPQSTTLTDLLAWTFIQLKEYDMALIQTIALDKRTLDNGSGVYTLSNILADNQAYETAAKGYTYLLEKGKNQPYFIPAKIELLKIKKEQVLNQQSTQKDLQSLAQSYEEILEEMGYTPRSLQAILELAKLKAYYLNQISEAENLLELALDIKGIDAETQADIKLDLADMYVLNGNFWDASLTLGQIEKAFPNTPLGQEAKFKNAKISFYKGDFKWAKSQLDVLKASTSQLIANDALDLSLLIQDNTFEDTLGNALKIYARAEFLRFKNKNEDALLILDSITVKYPFSSLADDILSSKAKIYLVQQKISEAILVYQEIIQKHPQSIWADDALYNLAALHHEKLANKEKAIQYYQQLIENFPGSLYVIEARKKYRLLRGDAL